MFITFGKPDNTTKPRRYRPPLPPPQDDDPIITQFTTLNSQWELNGDNITRIDPGTDETILHNYCKCMNTTPLEAYRMETRDRVGNGERAQ